MLDSRGFWQGRNVCRLKGGWLWKAPSPGSRRPAKPCGKGIRHPEMTGRTEMGGCEAVKDEGWQESQVAWHNWRGGRILMSGNAEKTKFSIRVDMDLVELADAYIRDGTVKNRTELIEDALRFYLGFLTTKKAEDYLLQSLSSVMTGTVRDTENRLARMDFKVAVELSKLCHVIAYTHDVDEDALNKLHLKCLDEVRCINGAVDFEDAYKYQKRET